MTEMTSARVKRLRLAQNLSQLELAEQSGVASGAISMIESGAIDVPESAIAAIARALDCEPKYLERPSSGTVSTRPLLRAYADAPKRAVDAIEADNGVAIDAAKYLGLTLVANVLDHTGLPLFEGDLNDEIEIEQFALQVRTSAGLAPESVVGNSMRTAERLGCVVLPIDSAMGRHLGVSMRTDDVAVIRVSRPSHVSGLSIPGDRQRFTVAHELGHLVLHHSTEQPRNPAQAAKVEREANRFASAFLVPGDPVLQDLSALGGKVTLTTLSKLKEKWGFAIKAFVIRFEQLGVIDDDHARSLYKQISARKWNKSEPVLVGNESAVWMARAIGKKYGSGPAGLSAAAREVGISSSYFERWTDWSPAAAPENVIDFAAVKASRG